MSELPPSQRLNQWVIYTVNESGTTLYWQGWELKWVADAKQAKTYLSAEMAQKAIEKWIDRVSYTEVYVKSI